jgi:hypothetical protein
MNLVKLFRAEVIVALRNAPGVYEQLYYNNAKIEVTSSTKLTLTYIANNYSYTYSDGILPGLSSDIKSFYENESAAMVIMSTRVVTVLS